MKTLVCVEPRKLEFVEGERPKLQKGSAIIKIKRIGICGTDLHAFEGTQPFFNYPRILGHELAGELECGGVIARCQQRRKPCLHFLLQALFPAWVFQLLWREQFQQIRICDKQRAQRL